MTDSQTACVIGAGPAGIVTAKTLMEDDFDVTVYEKYDEVGGTWSSHRRYVDLHHQLDKGIFEFSDVPNDGAYESAESVQSYLEEYADRFDVTEHIHLDTEVRTLERAEDGWRVETGRTDGGRRELNYYDYVAVCCGFHHIPKLPDVPGLEAFDGEVLHSSQVADESAVSDARVVVVGAGKSAIDLATKAGEFGSDVRLVFREANWLFPRKIFGGVLPHRFIFYSRFGESLLPRYYNDDCVRLIDRLPRAFKDGMWRVIEKDLLLSGGLWGVDELVPDRELPHDIVHTGILPESFPDLVSGGRITPTRSTVEGVEESGVRLGTGEFVEADVLVFATGFEKEIPFLDGLDLKTDEDQFALYRAIVPPGVDDLGVVGLRQSFNNILTMEVSAHWLSAYFREDLVEMPTEEEMRETMERRLEWQERVMPGTKGYHYGPYDLHAVDELLADMGVSRRRTGNPVSEYLLPGAKARRYADLHEEREQATATASPASGGTSIRGTITSLVGSFAR